MFHIHKYKVIDSKQYQVTYRSNMITEGKSRDDITKVLYRCEECGKYKVKRLNGSWNIQKEIIEE